VEHPEAFDHVGLLVNEPPAHPGCSLSSHPTTLNQLLGKPRSSYSRSSDILLYGEEWGNQVDGCVGSAFGVVYAPCGLHTPCFPSVSESSRRSALRNWWRCCLESVAKYLPGLTAPWADLPRASPSRTTQRPRDPPHGSQILDAPSERSRAMIEITGRAWQKRRRSLQTPPPGDAFCKRAQRPAEAL
jgi:hypothetical protein